MITCPSSKEEFSRTSSQYARSAKEKEPGLKESQYRKDDYHRRPMSDTQDENQTLPQGRLPGKVAPRKSSEVCTIQTQWVRQKYKPYGSQIKFCRDPLESCKPSWISTTKEDHSVWAKYRLPSQSARAITQVRDYQPCRYIELVT